MENFKQVVNLYYNAQLKQNLKEQNYQVGHPILKGLLIIQGYKIFQLVMIIFSCAYFLGLIWHIITKDLIDWRNVQPIDVYQGNVTFYTWPDYGFMLPEDSA